MPQTTQPCGKMRATVAHPGQTYPLRRYRSVDYLVVPPRVLTDPLGRRSLRAVVNAFGFPTLRNDSLKSLRQTRNIEDTCQHAWIAEKQRLKLVHLDIGDEAGWRKALAHRGGNVVPHGLLDMLGKR